MKAISGQLGIFITSKIHNLFCTCSPACIACRFCAWKGHRKMEEIIPQIGRWHTWRITVEIWTSDRVWDLALPLCSIGAMKKCVHLLCASPFPFAASSSHCNAKQSEHCT